MRRFLVLIFLNTLITAMVVAQDTLPKFSLSAKINGKVVISWRNNFQSVTQISIQRSYDSTRNFTTLLTVPDPSIPENGFVDSKASRQNMFYRLFIVMDNGNYMFSKSKRAMPDSGFAKDIAAEVHDDNMPSRISSQRITYMHGNQQPNISAQSKMPETSKVEIDKIYVLKEQDSVIGRLQSSLVKHFKDSILTKTKDTLVFADADTILIKVFVPKEVYKISSYVYTSKDGNVTISLPDAGIKKYSVKFLDQDLSPVLEVKDIKNVLLTVDKTNFVHAGWFRFELYENGKLKEKNKLFIPKDF
ncbi:MAG: hypothetical protein JST96_12760 [Bacteroidetes bacterium]|nr:hypothetical protein [Bacteroidota bacterium]